MDYKQFVDNGLMSISIQFSAKYGAASCTALFKIYMFPFYGVFENVYITYSIVHSFLQFHVQF